MKTDTQQHNYNQKITIIIIITLSFLYTSLLFIIPTIKVQKHIKQHPFTEIKDPQIQPDFDSQEENLYATYSIIEIEGQNTFIAVPPELDNSKPISIVLYSHGSITYVNKDPNNKLMESLIPFSTYFVNNNYIFAASNEHSPAWGNESAISDMENTLAYILDKYNISDGNYKLSLLGYSMGGLSSMHYAWKHQETVHSIALIAPTIRHYEWSENEFNTIADIPIKIWHGTQDLNISVSNSQLFVTNAKKYDKEILLELLPNETHWIYKPKLKEDILEFYIRKY